MAKHGDKTNLYLLAIVGIVAVVGVVMLILNSGTASISLSENDLSGEAISLTSGIVTEVKTGSATTNSASGDAALCCCSPATSPCKCGLTNDCNQCKGKC